MFKQQNSKDLRVQPGTMFKDYKQAGLLDQYNHQSIINEWFSVLLTKNNEDIIKFIKKYNSNFKHSISIYSINELGNNILHEILLREFNNDNNEDEIVKLIFKINSYVNLKKLIFIKNNDNRSPLDLAVEKNYKRVVEIFAKMNKINCDKTYISLFKIMENTNEGKALNELKKIDSDIIRLFLNKNNANGIQIKYLSLLNNFRSIENLFNVIENN